MMSFVPIMLMAGAAATVSLAEFEQMTPEAAGEIVLAGQDHGPIVAIERPGKGGLTPPNTAQFWLVEQPVLTNAGCTRKRWYVNFLHAMGTPRDDAEVTDAVSGTEIALAPDGACPAGQYVRINFDLEPETAFSGLALLQQMRAGERQYTYTCTDVTGSDLCESDVTVARELAREQPWLVQIGRGALRFTLGQSGVVTNVYISTASPDQIVIERIVPPPA